MRVTDKYVLFWDGPFSNWHKTMFILDDNVFYTSEHAYMYYKALSFNDCGTALKILETTHPSAAKELGRAVRNYDESHWASIRYQIMFRCLMAKFTQDKFALEHLVAYDGLSFVEASPVDCVWGIGLGVEDPLADNMATWRGTNLLGIALDEVRGRINKQQTI